MVVVVVVIGGGESAVMAVLVMPCEVSEGRRMECVR